MTQNSNLKLVIVYDGSQNSYTVSNHNLEPDKAAEQIEEWQQHLRRECRFIVLDQKRHHNTPDPQNCRACRDEVRRSSGLEPQPKFKRRKE